MAKVFRLHNGNNNITHWQGSQAYGNNAINEIKDPEGGVATKEITSIPSPLARIDLVKNAFKIISDQENLDGDTIYHKTVSESLDIGEIFLNLDKLKDKIEII